MSRLDDLVNEIPRGSFYPVRGRFLPFRSTPHRFRFETPTANRVFGIFINDVFRGTTISSAQGALKFEAQLPLGDVTLVLEDDVTARRYPAYMTVLKYGT